MSFIIVFLIQLLGSFMLVLVLEHLKKPDTSILSKLYELLETLNDCMLNRLPINQPAMNSEDEKEIINLLNQNQKRRILITEQIRTRLRISRLLNKKGYGFSLVSVNNVIASDVLESKVFELVLFDIKMPSLASYEIARKIRNNLDNKNTTIVFHYSDSAVFDESATKLKEDMKSQFNVKFFESQEEMLKEVEVRVKTSI